jgi:hypothetical protein
MSDYDGPATLVLPDGSEKVLQVQLRAVPASPVEQGRWNGTIDADRRLLIRAMESSFSLTLRMPDGREGQLVVNHVDDEVDENGICWAGVAGVGDAPFGPA